MAADMSLPWPANIPELKRLDELLRCGICYDFMSTSMVTACSHNYCSLCIRQYLDYKTQCPACFSETTSQQLRNNRLLDEILGLFPNLRDKVAKLCQTTKGNSITSYLESKELENQEPVDEHVNSTSNSSKYQEDSAGSPKATSVKDFISSPRIGKTPMDTPKRNSGKSLSSSNNSTHLRGNQAEPSTSGFSSTTSNPKWASGSPARIFNSQLSSPVPSTQSTRQTASGHFSIRNDLSTVSGGLDETKVSCPVCCVEVPERNINLHLDACLKRMEMGSEEEITVVDSTKRKPLPKLVYSLLSEKQLRQKLKDIGLSVQGDKPLLVSRHRRYTTLYNAECDTAEPRPVSQLIRQIEREERDEAKVANARSIFTYDRKTAPEIIEKEQSDYIKKNEDHFAKLIAEVKKRRADAKRAKESKKEQSEEVTMKPEEGNKTHNAEESRLLPKSTSEDDELKSRNNGSKREKHTGKIKKLFSLFNSNTLTDGVLSEQEKSKENCVKDSTVSDGEIPENNNDKIRNATVNSVEPPLTSSTVNAQNVDKDGFSTVKNIIEESCENSVVEPSPDFFSGSPAGSQSSCGSFSLLQDCDPLIIQNPELPELEFPQMEFISQRFTQNAEMTINTKIDIDSVISLAIPFLFLLSETDKPRPWWNTGQDLNPWFH
ncbi:E3 ubiquitin-protein ligase RAD18-like [Penaeus chinensis]|uniref:E3 ubiquitin-protein ligase RAD18-like n=1 Tax=Penaeus chinensis TaxID=139456 RepID=UPI001FB68AF8|nr:E3 ubiquitin-protein ligase RAD18-like [Penaeus chinensis]